MYLNKYIILATFWILTPMKPFLVANSVDEIVCNRLMDTRSLDECCGNLKLSNTIFNGSSCGWKHEWDYGACRYNCLFNHWKLFNSEKKLNMPSLDAMITRLYSNKPTHNEYGVALKSAFELCDKLATKYREFIMLHDSQLEAHAHANMTAGQNCPMDALLYGKCVAINVFLNCPAKDWNKDSNCDKTKVTVSECANLLNNDGNSKDMGYPVAESDDPRVRSAAATRSIGRNHFTWYTSFLNWLVF